MNKCIYDYDNLEIFKVITGMPYLEKMKLIFLYINKDFNLYAYATGYIYPGSFYKYL